MVTRLGLYEEMTSKPSPKEQAAASPARSKREGRGPLQKTAHGEAQQEDCAQQVGEKGGPCDCSAVRTGRLALMRPC